MGVLGLAVLVEDGLEGKEDARESNRRHVDLFRPDVDEEEGVSEEDVDETTGDDVDQNHRQEPS